MRSVAAILREMDVVRKSAIREDAKAKFVAQLERELEVVAASLPDVKPPAGAPDREAGGKGR